MKKLVILILFGTFYQIACAQTAINYDKEKLLDYYQSQRYAEAAAYLQSIYPADLQDVKALNQIAYCYMMAGKLPEAEKNYTKITAQQPDYVPVLFSLANINLRRGNKIIAQDYLERIVKLDSTNFNAFKQLAGLYLNQKDSLNVVYLEKANRLNPIEADVVFDLANAYKKQKKYEPAYQILSVAIAADTGNFILQQAKLPIAIELKKYKEVVTIGEQLLKGDADANVVKYVGMAYYYLKNYQKAIDYLKMLEASDMQTESTLYFTSLSYRALKNYKSAADYAKQTIEESISTNISSYYTLLGTVYEESEQLTAAAGAYQKGLQYKTSPANYYNLSLLYDLKLKQKSTALRYYNLYLKSKPDAKIEKAQIDFVKDRIVVLKASK